MKARSLNLFMAILLFVFSSAVIISCKGKVKDSDIESAVMAQVNSLGLQGINAIVKDGVVTVNGEIKDEAARLSLENGIKSINGVKSVVNNTVVAPPPPVQAPVEISTDGALIQSVNNVLRTYPGVRADVKEGVITLTGEIKRSDLSSLIQTLNGLKPKRVVNQLTIK